MPTNSELLLKGVVDAQAAALAPGMKADDFFELFCAVQLLKPYDLGMDEIRQGLLGGGGDGGIDGFYTLVDGEPLEAVTERSGAQRDHNLELLIFQAKDSPGFSGTAIDKLVSTVTAVFDFSRPLGGLRKLYNEQLLERAEAFRQFYSASIAKIARLDVRFVYFSAGEHVHEAVSEQGATLTAACERLFPDARTSVEFLGARELLQMSRTGRPEWHELQVREGPLVVGESGFVGMVSLSDYAAFVTDERGNRRRALFTDNVRDYEGRYGVNGAIAETLGSPTDDDFWTLNNGVTLIVQQARAGYRVLALQDPRIVNGLQTTTEIFEHFKRAPERDDRMLLVRVVVPRSDDSRDRIIVATNKQTPIAAGVLKATDRIHRDIEDYFAARGLFYERRRNEHRNDGRSLDAVVTMPYLARCMTATALLRPHLAVKVNAPSRLLTRPALYEDVFGSDIPLGAFHNAVRIMRRVEAHAHTAAAEPDEEVHLGKTRRPALWYAQWHLAAYVTMRATGRAKPDARRLAALTDDDISAVDLRTATEAVRRVLRELKSMTRRTEYQCAKMPLSVERLMEAASGLTSEPAPAEPRGS